MYVEQCADASLLFGAVVLKLWNAFQMWNAKGLSMARGEACKNEEKKTWRLLNPQTKV